jgi:hypothetical protein
MSVAETTRTDLTADPLDSTGTARGRALLRHLPFALLLLAGAVLRLLTWRAYRPALLFPDSRTYLLDAAQHALNQIRPSGYSVFILPLLHLGGLATITLVQHLMGLAMAVAIYALLLRLRVWPWLATLATLPLLLDSMQLVVEQYVMSDILFEALLLAACLALLWRPRPGAGLVMAAGLAIGVAAAVRGAGTLLLLPVAVTVLALSLATGWRRTVVLLVVLVTGFALPVAVYALDYHRQHGQFALTGYTNRFLYARLAPIADCRGLTLPSYEQSLCPSEPLGQRPRMNVYMWNTRLSPQYHVKPPAGMTVEQVLADFNRRIVLHQPVRYAQVVGFDFLRGFQPFRTNRPNDSGIAPWLFHATLSQNGVRNPAELYRSFAGYGPVLDRPLASALTSYQRFGVVPGPVLGACVVAALLAVLGVGRSRRSGLRVAAWTFAAVCLVPLVTAAMSSSFSWRYQLIQLVLLPPAGALALTALVRRPSPEATTATLADSSSPSQQQNQTAPGPAGHTVTNAFRSA